MITVEDCMLWKVKRSGEVIEGEREGVNGQDRLMHQQVAALAII
jgi:hypothetical protein